jgi:Outer membrane protein beta-barrel domain
MRRVILLTVLALGTTAAHADSGLFYLGAGVTDSSLTANNNGYIAYGTPDLKNNSWKAFAGVRPLNWLAVEVDYIDLGSVSSVTTFNNESTDTTHADSSAWAAYAIGFLPVPLPVVDFYGKVGVARWKLTSTLIQVPNFPPPGTITTPRSYSGTDFAWGVGVQAHIKMFGVRLEYEGFDVDNNTASVASLSVFLNF